jgi:hypothetical protein
MFNSKKIEKLELDVQELKNEIKRLNHLIEHKPKFEVGKKYKGCVCIKVEQEPQHKYIPTLPYGDFVLTGYRYRYTVFNIKTKKEEIIY